MAAEPTQHQANRCPLLEVPDDAIVLIACQHKGVACSLRETHPALSDLLRELCFQAKTEQQYRWRPCESSGVCILDRTLRCMSTMSWASCAPFPSVGRHVFSITIQNGEDHGGMVIGVCDEESRHGWGLNPIYGEVWRAQYTPRDSITSGLVTYAVARKPPPPAGFPDFNDHMILTGLRKITTGSQSKATEAGIVVDVVYDADMGTLSFSMSTTVCTGVSEVRRHESCSKALSGFPHGARLCPWVHLANTMDVVILEGKR